MSPPSLTPLSVAELRWRVTSERARGCTHPIRLVGSAEQVDIATGEVRRTYSSTQEPDAALYRPCGNRRESVCPSCSETYRRDAYFLISAGMSGGKGIPESVTGHPALFLTLSAPSFGPVHSRRTKGRVAEICAPRRKSDVCPHGQRLGCWTRHEESDPCLGEPICPNCFDYLGLVTWNSHAPALWKRTRLRFTRDLGRLVGMPERVLRKHVRLTFIKVAEVQHRGATHFHGILRADAVTEDGTLQPPPAWCTGELLRDAFDAAAATAWVPCPDPRASDAALRNGTAQPLAARWGTQNLAKILHLADGELSPAAVAGYIAKYATKSTDSLGSLDRPIRSVEALAHLQQSGRVRPHLMRIVRTAWDLGRRPVFAERRVRRWAHCLGFGGHWLTKSRTYSTTFGCLRMARRQHTVSVKLGGLEPLDAWGRPETEEAVVVLKSWRVEGFGYRTQHERDLALAAAARTREHRAQERAIAHAAQRT